MIITSHYMEDIQRLCERILIIRAGEIVYDGPLQRVKDHYALHKVIRAHLHRSPEPVEIFEEIRALGEVVECGEGQICLRVERADVPKASARILELYPVADLAIEEMDIGTIIERIFRERGEVVT